MEDKIKMDVLQKMNSLFGLSLIQLNVNYNDEDAAVFNELISSKLEDIPQIFYDLFTKLLNEVDDEFKKMSVGELLDMYIDYGPED